MTGAAVMTNIYSVEFRQYTMTLRISYGYPISTFSHHYSA